MNNEHQILRNELLKLDIMGLQKSSGQSKEGELEGVIKNELEELKQSLTNDMDVRVQELDIRQQNLRRDME